MRKFSKKNWKRFEPSLGKETEKIWERGGIPAF